LSRIQGVTTLACPWWYVKKEQRSRRPKMGVKNSRIIDSQPLSMQPKRNILYLTLNSSIGGTEIMILTLSKNLNREKYNPVICSLVGDGTLIREASNCGITAYDLKMRGPFDVTIIFKLLRLINKERIHIMHTYLYHTNILGRVMGWVTRVPVIISTQRSTDPWRKWYHRALDRITARLCDVIISNSIAGKERLIKKEKIKEDKIIIINNGIEKAFPCDMPMLHRLKEQCGILADSPVIGTVSNLKPAKGLRYLLQAFKYISEKNNKAKLVIVGYGELYNELEQYAEDLGVLHNVRFTGFQSNAIDYISFFDVFVISSLWEGTPVSLLEAMSLGKPVVATDVGGVAEVVKSGEDGVLVKPRNARLLADTIIEIMSNKTMRKELGENAARKIEQKFNTVDMVKNTEVLYESIINKKKTQKV